VLGAVLVLAGVVLPRVIFVAEREVHPTLGVASELRDHRPGIVASVPRAEPSTGPVNDERPRRCIRRSRREFYVRSARRDAQPMMRPRTTVMRRIARRLTG